MNIGSRVVILEFQPLSSMAEYTGMKGEVLDIFVSNLRPCVKVKLDNGEEIQVGGKYIKEIKP